MENESVNEYVPRQVSHPGGTVLDLLEEREMSAAELARRIGRPQSAIDEMIAGKATITSEMAVQLERVLGPPAKFWMKRQERFDADMEKIKEEDNLQWAK